MNKYIQLKDNMRDKKIIIRVDDKEKKNIETLRKEGYNISALVRKTLNEYYEKSKTRK